MSAAGLLLFGVLLLWGAWQRRTEASRPIIDEELRQEGYGGLVREAGTTLSPNPESAGQMIVVTTIDLEPGDQVLPEFVEARPARTIADLQTTLRAGQPLEGYHEEIDAVVGQYATVPLPAGTPLSRGFVIPQSPFANPYDRARIDRITIAMPPEPTIYPLMVPGDRVDIYLVAHGQVSDDPIPSVRVVAVNDIAVEGAGLVSPEQEQRAISAQEQAAVRRRQELLQRQAQQGAQTPPEDQPAEGEDETPEDTPEETPAEGEAGATGTTGTEDDEELPEGTARVGREFDGRTVTLQVTPSEAMVLAMAERTPAVTLAFTLKPRR